MGCLLRCFDSDVPYDNRFGGRYPKRATLHYSRQSRRQSGRPCYPEHGDAGRVDRPRQRRRVSWRCAGLYATDRISPWNERHGDALSPRHLGYRLPLMRPVRPEMRLTGVVSGLAEFSRVLPAHSR
jgi:hypothetical protein